ncbi:MAG: MCE family protein [Chloroflexi bacterium]|nr:MCE family protein [Chloroflexota bacterium]
MQDLTPQLRTRLNRVERTVGWFVFLATLLLLAGFVYYVYHTAERKGWFVTKVTYYTLADTAAGLKVGDPVKLMGFDVGEITRIDAQPPEDIFNVYVEFQVTSNYFGYLWTQGSRARVTAADFLGKRFIEVTKGTNGVPTHLTWQFDEVTLAEARNLIGQSNILLAQEIRGEQNDQVLARALQPLTKELCDQLSARGIEKIPLVNKKERRKFITAIWDDQAGLYLPFTKKSGPYWLPPIETPALTERLDGLIKEVELALPGILNLTNQLAAVLTNANNLAAHADGLVQDARPIVTNLSVITAQLREPKGALGEWLIPTNLNLQLLATLTNADATLTNANATLSAANTNLVVLAASLEKTLENLAAITGHLHSQIQSNTNILSSISAIIIHTDELIQGLKKHWLLRSAFREKQPAVPPPSRPPVPSKGAEGLR